MQNMTFIAPRLQTLSNLGPTELVLHHSNHRVSAPKCSSDNVAELLRLLMLPVVEHLLIYTEFPVFMSCKKKKNTLEIY